MSKDDTIKKKLDKETSIYQNIQLPCIPTFLANVNLQDYILMCKVQNKVFLFMI